MSKNNSEDLYSIGNRIRDERERQGLTQEQLAELSDLSPRTISRIETGTTISSVDRLVGICSALKITLNHIQPESLDIYADSSTFASEIISCLNNLPTEKRRVVEASIRATISLAEM